MTGAGPPGPGRPWREAALRVGREVKEGRASIMAGGVAFYGFLSMFPALAALVSIYGLLADTRDVERQMDALAGFVPENVRNLVQAELSALAERSAGTLSVELVAGVALALWAANKGTRTLMIAVDLVLDPGGPRNIVRVNSTALVITACGIVAAALALAAVVAVPNLLVWIGMPVASARLVAWLRWPALAAVLLLALALVYGYGPTRRPARWRWITPGSAFAVTLWLPASVLFSWFVSSFERYSRLEGSLAAFVVVLGWFLLSAYAIILGAAVDAALTREE